MATTLDDARHVMSTTVARWEQLLARVPAELIERRPLPGEWSAAECLQHLMFTERHIFGVRLRALLAGQDLVPYDPDAPRDPEPEHTAPEQLAALAALRADNARTLDRLTDADLARTAHHPEYGTVTLEMLVNVWAAHDLQHTVQAEHALMQAFIPNTGHWRWEFAEQDVEARAAARS